MLPRRTPSALIAAITTVAVLWAPQAAWAEVDQSQFTVDTVETIRFEEQMAQTFTAGVTGTLSSLNVYLSRGGSTPSTQESAPLFRLQVTETTAGVPDDTLIMRAVLPEGVVPWRAPGGPAPRELSLDLGEDGPLLVAGGLYAIKLSIASSTTTFNWHGSAGNTYSGGTTLRRASSTSAWAARPGDRGFFTRVLTDIDRDGHEVGTGDCDDRDAAVNPAATEVFNGKDDDCDGTIDDDHTAYYADADGDTYGAGAATHATAPPTGTVTNAADCNDSAAGVNPRATEITNGIDDDCDGTVDEVTRSYYLDSDGDGYGAGSAVSATTVPAGHVGSSNDCDDTSPAVSPGATEAYNGKDDDCDGTTDEGFTPYYSDADGDAYGAGAPTYATTPPTGKVTNAADCDDSAARVNPRAAETSNGIDDDCDGTVDEGTAAGTTSSFYRDADGDGYGAGTEVTAAIAPDGHVSTSSDCDDTAPGVSPGARETFNGKDDDCDGIADEGFTAYYADADGDTYGAGAPTHATAPPSGKVANAADCDDSAAAVNPRATETTNGVDDDCDGAVDESSTLGIGISPSTVRFGQQATVVITGSPGATVDLFTRKHPSTEFTRIRTGLVLDAAGRISVPTRPDVNLRFQARDSTGTTRSSIAGAAGLITVEKHVTLTVRRTGTRTYVFSGSVNPLHPGATVNLYRDGVLQKSGIPVGSTRAYTYTRTFAGAGAFTFQVRSPGTGYNALSSSPAVVVRVS